MARVDTLPHFLTDVADAIRTKGGTSTTIQASSFDTAIANLPSGGTTDAEMKDVNFYDYDGTRLHSYTKAEFLALESMPNNPTHDGLIAEGWNWSLSEAQTYVTSYNKLEIGQYYKTTDGKTRIYITLSEDELYIGISFALNGSAVVDWGDGTTDSVAGASTTTRKSAYHTYSSPGNHCISISNPNNDIYITGSNSTSYLIPTAVNRHLFYKNKIYKIELGDNVVLGNNAFLNFKGLQSVVIPKNITLTGTTIFSQCHSLKYATIPKNVTSLPMGLFFSNFTLKNVSLPYGLQTMNSEVFYACGCLQRVTLPNTLTDAGAETFMTCYSLDNTSVPNSVTSIKNYMFASTASAYYYFLTYTSVVPLEGVSAFSSFQGKIVVPDSLYQDWITASNWSTLASFIIKESDL